MTKIIGLTGGIGSGKTTIANYFKSLGVPVYIADDAAKQVMEFPEIIAEIKNTFGANVFENEKLNRQKLADIVFNNPEQLQKLNAIVHPAVKKHFESWLSEHSSFPIIIKEAAILFESGSYKDCDLIITVNAPLETRIKRVMDRDNANESAILKRVNNQWTDEMRSSKSDYIIDNVDLAKAKWQAKEILKKLINLYN